MADNVVANTGVGGATFRAIGRGSAPTVYTPVSVIDGGGEAGPELLIVAGQNTMANSLPVTLASNQTNLPANIAQVGAASLALGQTTMSASVPVTLASNQSNVGVSGTVTANIGTTNGLALDTSVNGLLVSQGSTTSGEKGPLIQGAVTTAAPSYTTAQTSPLSLTTAGLLRVDASGTTVSITANSSVNLGQVGGSSVALGQTTMSASIPVTLASNQSNVGVTGTVTANIGTTNGLALDTSVNGLLVAQGSTTSGEKGPLIQGAVTTAAPSYTTAQTSPLSLTTAGLLRVDASGTTVSITANSSVNLAQVGGSSVALGQTTMSASIPVTIASNQSAVPASQSGTWTVQPGNTANTTPWLVQAVAGTGGGASMFTLVSAANNNSTQVKSSGGTVSAIVVVNTTATIAYLKLFDGAPTMGTTNANWNIPIPANTSAAGVSIPLPDKLNFSTTINIALTGGIGLNDNSNATTGVAVNLAYK